MSFHQLPIELLCAILSHLNLDEFEERQSLRACASTCRAFVSPAQAIIFHTLDLSYGSRDVLAKLGSTPHIRTFVKRLSLFEIHQLWIKRSEVFHDILGFLSPYVVSLDIHQQRRKQEYPRFDFSSLAQLKFVQEISLKEEISLTEVHSGALEPTRYGDNALPTFLNHFPKLGAITLKGCWVRNETIDSISDIVAPIFRLERLDVWCCRDALLLDWLMPALSSLRELHFSYPATISATNVAQFMIKAGESLQHLGVRTAGDASNADLQSLMTAVRTYASDLRSFNFMATTSKYLHHDSQIQVVVQSLLLLGSHAHLQHLTIELSVHCAVESPSRVHGSSWDDLQDLLVGTRFPALRSVEFRWLVVYPDSIPIAIEPLIAALPLLAKRIMISVHVCHYRLSVLCGLASISFPATGFLRLS